MGGSPRRNRLEQWLREEHAAALCRGGLWRSILVFAEAWGKTVSRSEAIGRPMGAIDAFVSARAEIHRLTLVTRNVSDFPMLKAVVNPGRRTVPCVLFTFREVCEGWGTFMAGMSARLRSKAGLKSVKSGKM